MNNITTKSHQNNNDVIDLRELLYKYLSKWYWFVLSVVLCVAVAFVYLRAKNPKFEVKSVIMIRNNEDPATSALSQIAVLQSMGIGGSKMVADELYIINSKNLMRQTIQQLGVQTEYRKKKGMRYIEQYPLYDLTLKYAESVTDTIKFPVKMEIVKRTADYRIKIKYGKQVKGVYEVENLGVPFKTCIGTLSFEEHKPLEVGDKMRIVTYPMSALIEMYQRALTASQVKKESNVIAISTVSETPGKAIAMVNKLIELYNLDAVIDKNIMASNTGSFIEDRLKLITEELTSVEEDVEQYKKDNKLTDISAEAQLFLNTSSEYQKRVAELETQLNLVEYIQSYVKDEKNQYNLIPANLGIEDRSLVELVGEYNKTLLERMKLLRTTNAENPVIVQLEEQLRMVRGNIITSINSVKDGLNIAKDDVLHKDSQFMARIKSVPTQERQYIEIKRQQQIKETLYLFLYQKREENALMLASTVQPAKTIDTAEVSPTPVSPRTLIVLFVAMVLGCCIPIGGIFVYEFINDTIVDKKEYEKLIKAPVVGQICQSRGSSRIVVGEGNTTPVAELFRLVRTNIHFMLTGKQNPVILVTSSINGEGKSFIALNLALSLALMKKKVVLIGLDIRNPMLSNYMHLSQKGYLTVYLADVSYDSQDIIFPSKVHPFLDVIPAGPIPPNPAELLMSNRLDELVSDMRTQYDYVLIDSAPVGMVSDTFLLNRFVDMTLYISRANYTPRATADFINDVYEKERLNNMACVLNGVDEKMKVGYGYGYGYGYGQKKK